jgi:hypothetical protein
MTKIIASIIAAGLAASALAHDPSQHKGKPVVGEVVSVSKDRFEIKTATGTVPATFSAKTKFEHGTATVDSSHLRMGEKVHVFGTKLPTGDLVAKEVVIGAAAKGNAPASKKTQSDSHAGDSPARKK